MQSDAKSIRDSHVGSGGTFSLIFERLSSGHLNVKFKADQTIISEVQSTAAFTFSDKVDRLPVAIYQSYMQSDVVYDLQRTA